ADRVRICPGDSVSLRVPVTDTYSDATVKYAWTAEGGGSPGANSEYSFRAPENGGDYTINVHVTDDSSTVKDKLEMHGLQKLGPVAAVEKTIVIHVDPYPPPTIACSANPTTLDIGQTSALHATATASACNGNLSYIWSASEGSVSGNSADATY